MPRVSPASESAVLQSRCVTDGQTVDRSQVVHGARMFVRETWHSHYTYRVQCKPYTPVRASPDIIALSAVTRSRL
jgi:hypothetical protein